MSQPVSSMMRQPVHSVGMDDKVAAVEALLDEHRLSWVPVLQPGGQVLGVISATDLLHFHAAGGNAQSAGAWQLCTYKPITVAPTTPVGEVAALMLERRIHHVVVIDGAAPVGVVSSFDFVRRFVMHTTGHPEGAVPPEQASRHQGSS